jgi:hypothetical protein
MEYPKLRLVQTAYTEHQIQSIPTIFPAKISRAIELPIKSEENNQQNALIVGYFPHN